MALDGAIGDLFGNTVFARVLRLESRVWLYQLFKRPIRNAFSGLRHFHVGKQRLNASSQLGFLIVVGAEIPIARLFLYLFDPTVAAIVTAVSVYGFLAVLLHPMDELAAMEFLLDKMKTTKSNDEFLVR